MSQLSVRKVLLKKGGFWGYKEAASPLFLPILENFALRSFSNVSSLHHWPLGCLCYWEHNPLAPFAKGGIEQLPPSITKLSALE
jgi:hypothetical protein